MYRYYNLITSSARVVPLIFIAGQSNAQGSLTGPPTLSYLTSTITGANIWITDHWETLVYPDNNLGFNDAFAAELNVGYLLHKATNKQVYIVKITPSGSSLAQIGGDTNNWINNHSITSAATLNTVVANLQASGIKFSPYIYWNQGEADANNLAAANAYKTNFEIVMNYFRTNITDFSNAKVIACRLKSGIPITYEATVRAQLELVSLSNFTIINQDDLTTVGDQVHFTAESQQTLGERLYNSII